MNFLAGNVSQQLTQAEKELRPLLFDEAIQVISTFELNKVASLTFNDITCDDMFAVIERICSKPLDHTPLSIQKALVVIKHIVIYGQEKTVNHAYGLQDYFKALTTFNTVIMAQKQGGAMAFFQTIQGGGVDKGGPVRVAAEDLVKLLSNIHELRRIRNASASQNSLVPVGDDNVAFVTDEVRHHILKQKIIKETQVQIKSNLAKAENGFGAGYSASDGRSVVGAAHGIEEMIKMAKIQKKSFSDDNSRPPGYKTEEERILEELQAEAAAAAKPASEPTTRAPEADLLGFSTVSTQPAHAAAAKTASEPTTTAPEADLLGFSTVSTQPAHEVDLLGLGYTPSTSATQLSSTTNDLLGAFSSFQPTASDPFSNDAQSFIPTQHTTTNEFINGGLAKNSPEVAVADPFAFIASPTIPNLSGPGNFNHLSTTTSYAMSTSIQTLTATVNSMALGGTSALPHNAPVEETSKEDRFKALDALVSTNACASSLLEANNTIGKSNITTSAMNPGLDSLYGGVSATDSYHSAAPQPADSYGMPVSMTAAPFLRVPENMVTPGNGSVAKSYGDPGSNVVDENPWLLGGTPGSGLQAFGPAPAAPPPPPLPGAF